MNDICVIASYRSALSGIHRAATRWLVAVGLAAFALVVGAVVPTPTVTGPLAGDVPGTAPGHNYPFFATHIVMSDYGYVEQEFYMDGTATNFGNPNGTANATVVSTGNPYRTRLLVRRPVDPAKFNGTVIVEWFNVTNGWDLDVFWQEQMAYYIREGYVWVGVTAQNASVTNATTGLKVWSPTRYGTMNLNNSGTVGNDQLGYDIFSQAAQAVRKVPIVLGGLTPQTVIGAGESQSAGRVHTYVNSIHILDPIYDGFIVAHGNGTTRPEVTVPVHEDAVGAGDHVDPEHSGRYQQGSDLGGGRQHAFGVLHDDPARADPAAGSQPAGFRYLRDAGAKPCHVLHGHECGDRRIGQVDPHRRRTGTLAAATGLGHAGAAHSRCPRQFPRRHYPARDGSAGREKRCRRVRAGRLPRHVRYANAECALSNTSRLRIEGSQTQPMPRSPPASCCRTTRN